VAETVLYALGLVLVVEGLVFALAPSRIEDALEMLRRLGRDARRLIGLTALAAGVALIGLARWIGS
jgi:uncharacterized protein YjeT (DUF2065 family)